MNNDCHCPILGQIEATKEAIKPWAPVTRHNEEILSKQIGAVNSECQGKEDDVVDHPGGKLEL